MTMTHPEASAPEQAPYDVDQEPFAGIRVWELTERERAIYELGFLIGYAARQPEVDQLDHEADRLYVAAFDHRHCACWRGRKHNVTW